MPVNSKHIQVEQSQSKWKLTRDCMKGPKAMRQAGLDYLPHPNATGDDAAQRYKDYAMRAIFTNVIKPTNDSMVGMAFRKPPLVEMPTQLEYLIDNATGSGVTLEQLAKLTVSNLLITGRYGLLADYPTVEAGQSEAAVSAQGIQANIKTYIAESIINWETTNINGVNVLSLVVLKEDYMLAADKFSGTSHLQYRVLELVDGLYTISLYRDGAIIGDPLEPKDSTGARLKFIPFVMAGAYANDPDVDEAPLYDIAEINIGHYRNSADKEEGLFLHSQPMLHLDIGDMNATAWNEANPHGVQVGARRGLITAGGGKASLLQTVADDAISKEMSSKMENMKAIGARLVDNSGPAETATAAMLRHSGTNSVLTNVVQNASSALELVLLWAGSVFMGVNEAPVYQINDDFYDKQADAATIEASIKLYDRGVIAKADLRESARQTGMINADRTDEDLDAESEAVNPLNE